MWREDPDRLALHEPLRMIVRVTGPAVANIDQTLRAIEANGGRIAAPKFHIPTVGIVAYFFDTEDNVAAVIQQEPHP